MECNANHGTYFLFLEFACLTLCKDAYLLYFFSQTMEIDIVDQYNLWVECFNHDLLESDELIGAAQCSLLPAFKRGNRCSLIGEAVFSKQAATKWHYFRRSIEHLRSCKIVKVVAM